MALSGVSKETSVACLCCSTSIEIMRDTATVDPISMMYGEVPKPSFGLVRVAAVLFDRASWRQ